MTDPNDHVTQALPDVEPRWLALLKQTIADHPGRGGVLKAAQAMGVSRTYVARVLMTGENRVKHPSPEFVRRALEAFGNGRVDCPHLAAEISLGRCQAFAALEWKVIRGSGPEKALHWRACQNCPQKPLNPKEA